MTTRTVTAFIVGLISLNMFAQTSSVHDKDVYAGHFQSYRIPEAIALQPIPKGFKPFYISHFSRHGSRYHSSEKYYKNSYTFLKKAYDAGVLTPLGEQMYNDVKLAMTDAHGKWGDLTPRGHREHKGIAQRMYQSYPQVFKTDRKHSGNVSSVSTTVVRCVLSMSAFNEGLKECNPNLNMTRVSSDSNKYYMFERTEGHAQYKEAKMVTDSLKREWLPTERFFTSIIKDPEYINSQLKKPELMMYEIYTVASIMQDVDYLGVSMWHYFTEDELEQLWRCENAFSYLTMGPSERIGSKVLNDAKPMLRDILQKAEGVIDGSRDIAADLRFGHDCTLIPLMSLIEVQGATGMFPVDEIDKHWRITDVSSMAGNFQMIFFKNKKGDIKVRFLLNEREAKLPLAGHPFYDWEDVKSFFEKKI